MERFWEFHNLSRITDATCEVKKLITQGSVKTFFAPASLQFYSLK
jgi:hypothetical protein